jgi:hypothetical protein
VVALDAARGSALAVQPLAGAATHLLVAPGPDGTGDRLYCFELDGFADSARTPLGPGRLLVLSSATLEAERAYPLPYTPAQFAGAPNGSSVYSPPGGCRALQRNDLPSQGMGLGVTGRVVYVATPWGARSG